MLFSESFINKVKDVLNESVLVEGVDNKSLKMIAALTDNNDHGQAIVVGCRSLGLHDLSKEASRIRKEHMRLGGLNQDLIDRRASVSNKMHDHAKKVLSAEDYKKFYDSY